LPEPDEIAAQIMEHLRTATEEMTALLELLEPEADQGDVAGDAAQGAV
jgi:hypothetical protein